MNAFENYRPDILPHPIKRVTKAILSFVTERHTVPYAQGVGADEMLMTEDVSGAVDRTGEYWQPVLDWADERN